MADFDPAKAREMAREARVVCDWRRTDTRPIGEPCPCYSCHLADQLVAACDEIDKLHKEDILGLEPWRRLTAQYLDQLSAARARLATAREALAARDCDHPSSNGTGLTFFGEKVFRCGICRQHHICVRVDFDYTVNLSDTLVEALEKINGKI